MIDYDASFANTDGSPFPDTEAVNVSAPGAGDGTEFVALMVNDIWGRAQALLDYAGLTPDGVMEAPDTAQILEAIGMGFGVGPGIGVIYWKNDTPAAWGDRILLLQGQEISQATYALLFAAVYCGDADNATAATFYSTDGVGNRLTPGGGGTHFVIPDTRGLPLKNIGNATINARVKTGPTELGELQEDRGQGFQVGSTADTTGARNYWGRAGQRDNYNTAAAAANNATWDLATTLQGVASKLFAVNDGTNGDYRQGLHFRDSSIGTNFGITY